MKKLLSILLALILILSVFTGCSSKEENSSNNDENIGEKSTEVKDEGPAKEGSGVLRLYASRPLESLNPHMVQASATADFLDKIQGYLYRLMPTEDGETYRIVPELAEGEPKQLDGEGKEWEIKINPEAKWANGEQITAEDFEYSWKMLLDPRILNEKADIFIERGLNVVNVSEYFKQGAEGAKPVDWKDIGVKAVDPSTLKLTLSTAISSFTLKNALSDTSFAPVYKKLYEAGMNADRTDTTFGTNVDEFMSSGPFKITDWQRDVEYAAVKNPNSPLSDNIWLAEIRTKVITEAGTAMQLFESNQLDYVALNNANYERYAEDPRLVVVPYRTVYHMVLNAISEDKSILQNKKFRQALSYGTNREEIGEIALVEPANYYITDYYVADVDSGTFYRNTDEAKAILKPSNGYDPEKAMQLFDEAMAESGIDKIDLEICYHDGRESRKLASEYIQRAWPVLFGTDRVTINLQAVPSSQLSAKLRSHVNDVNAFEIGWTGSSWNYFDHTSVVSYFHSKTARRKWPYFSKEYDALVEKLREVPESDKKRRIEIASELEAMLLEDVPSIPVFRPKSFYLFSEDLDLAINQYHPIMGWAFMWAKK